MNNKKVAIGLSGGVDSAVAAALLKKEGYEVLGVTMKIWDGRPLPEEGESHGCYGSGEVKDVEDAARISDFLGIPFEVVDLAEDFNKGVLDLCSRQYLSGVTPNPCVYCNRKLKFDLIPEQLAAKGIELDYFATGHYARIEPPAAEGRYLLKKGLDAAKDQSYFLFLLGQKQLARTLFPLGKYTKDEIRQMAAKMELPVAEKAESQDFVSGGYDAIFEVDDRPGPIVNQNGEILGEHRGIHLFTIGQRRGLKISFSEPLYVTDLISSENKVVVGTAEELYSNGCIVSGLNWISIAEIATVMRLDVRIRYRHQASSAEIFPLANDQVRIVFDEPQRAITPGQAAVFYDRDTVVGGGIIEKKEV